MTLIRIIQTDVMVSYLIRRYMYTYFTLFTEKHVLTTIFINTHSETSRRESNSPWTTEPPPSIYRSNWYWNIIILYKRQSAMPAPQGNHIFPSKNLFWSIRAILFWRTAPLACGVNSSLGLPIWCLSMLTAKLSVC